MKKRILFLMTFVILFMVVAVSSCSKDESNDTPDTPDNPDNMTGQIEFTVNQMSVQIAVAGKDLSVDWGNGIALASSDVVSELEYPSLGGTITSDDFSIFSRNFLLLRHTAYLYQIFILKIKGTELTHFFCIFNQLTSLDVSKNPALTWLFCSYNQLTSLDVSKNPALKELNCSDNQLTTDALNTLFTSLPVRTISDNAQIEIGGNPGTAQCDRQIAENKGWRVWE
jgi:Leucine-rich repeat (LRR) protein